MTAFYREQQGKLIPQTSLLHVLELPDRPHLVISLVGAGGKTSTMYQLADELAAEGKRVIVTTSTHIFCPEDRQVVLTDRAEAVIPFLSPGQVVIAGQPAPEHKLRGLPPQELKRLAAEADVLLIEADGAKCLPLKVPRDGEPVLIEETHVVIACAGLDSIGQTFEKACFRYGTDGSWVRGAGAERTDVIAPCDVARILTDERGFRKGVGDREYRIVLNKADDEECKTKAAEVIRLIRKKYEGVCRSCELCAVTSYCLPA